MELGNADDALFYRVISKQGEGKVGVWTRSMIDSAGDYGHAIKLAVILPFLWPDHYFTKE
jgi:hypothetical protein